MTGFEEARAKAAVLMDAAEEFSKMSGGLDSGGLPVSVVVKFLRKMSSRCQETGGIEGWRD